MNYRAISNKLTLLQIGVSFTNDSPNDDTIANMLQCCKVKIAQSVLHEVESMLLSVDINKLMGFSLYPLRQLYEVVKDDLDENEESHWEKLNPEYKVGECDKWQNQCRYG